MGPNQGRAGTRAGTPVNLEAVGTHDKRQGQRWGSVVGPIELFSKAVLSHSPWDPVGSG